MKEKILKLMSKKVCKWIGILLLCAVVIAAVFQSGLAWNLSGRLIGWDVEWNPWKDTEIGTSFQVSCSEDMNEAPFGGPGYYIEVQADTSDTIIVRTSQGILVPWQGCSPEDLDSEKMNKCKVSGSDSYTFAWGAEGEDLFENTYFLVTAYRNGMVKGRGLVRFSGKKDKSQAGFWRGNGTVLYQKDYT